MHYWDHTEAQLKPMHQLQLCTMQVFNGSLRKVRWWNAIALVQAFNRL